MSFSLARWFTESVNADKPEYEFLREELLQEEVYKATHVGVSKDKVIVKTPHGVAMVELKTVKGCKLMVFDFVRDDKWERYNFWYNLSSVKDLGDYFRTLPRVSFNDLFLYGTATK